jgi:hypothetical protein
VSKAVKGLVGGVAPGSATERADWAVELIPRSGLEAGPCTQQDEAAGVDACAWGDGDLKKASREMKEAGKRPGAPLVFRG